MIKNIIFDFGNVLARVDFRGFQKNILREVEDRRLLIRLISNPLKNRYETGLISSKVFLDQAIKILDYRISRKRFLFYFNNMLSELPEMRRYLTQISKSRKYKLFVLSNTNPIHVNYARKRLPYIYANIHYFILSYKVKVIKPNSAIYKYAITRYNLKPDETIYIDDLKENCITAEKLGFYTVHYRGFKSFNKQFFNVVRTN